MLRDIGQGYFHVEYQQTGFGFEKKELSWQTIDSRIIPKPVITVFEQGIIYMRDAQQTDLLEGKFYTTGSFVRGPPGFSRPLRFDRNICREKEMFPGLHRPNTKDTIIVFLNQEGLAELTQDDTYLLRKLTKNLPRELFPRVEINPAKQYALPLESYLMLHGVIKNLRDAYGIAEKNFMHHLSR